MTMVLFTSKLIGGVESFGRNGLWTPVLTQLRFRSRPSLKEPTKFRDKLKLLELVKPIYPEKPNICSNILNKASGPKNSIEDNKNAQFMARNMRSDFYNHPMIAIFHSNSYTSHELLHIWGHLYDNDFDMKLHYLRINKAVAIEALKGTKFEPALPIIASSKTSIGYCANTDFAKLLHCLKKMPQFILIGLIVENRLLHRADIERLAKLPDITSVHAQLCHILQLPAIQLNQTLTSNQSTLCASLSSLTNSQNSETNGPNSDDPPSPSVT